MPAFERNAAELNKVKETKILTDWRNLIAKKDLSVLHRF